MAKKKDENLSNKKVQIFKKLEDRDENDLIDKTIAEIKNSSVKDNVFPVEAISENIKKLAVQEYNISVEAVTQLIKLTSSLFKTLLLSAGYEEKKIRAIITKFRDAGRRSAPWKPTSSRVPGSPQDGKDGNRINRWELPLEHKFYASQVDATLVEVKYFLQALSMNGSPSLQDNSIQDSFIWLLEHSVKPGIYLDPIQLIPIEFSQLIDTPRTIQSGHLIPLDRGGKHTPQNTFLMLERSNQIQGNQTLDELLELMTRVVKGYHEKGRI
ncbi:MAG: hypothetical protein ACKPB7_26825 [Sphaerospermopsis kisseleviana]